VRPVDTGGRAFPLSGGLLLGKRAPQRQSYRLLEHRRVSQWLGLPIHPQPACFPVSGDDAARLIIAVCRDDLDIADESMLAALLLESGLNPARLR
jgi:2-hydroxychromene-2-carboxylate isomerase